MYFSPNPNHPTATIPLFTAPSFSLDISAPMERVFAELPLSLAMFDVARVAVIYPEGWPAEGWTKIVYPEHRSVVGRQTGTLLKHYEQF